MNPIRHIPALLALLALAALAACVQPSFETAETGRALNVTAVEIAFAGGDAASVVTGRQGVVAPAKLVADLDGTLTAMLERASDPAGEPVTVMVAVSEVYLAPPIERVIAGTSYINGTVSVTGADGTQVVPPTAVRGNTANIRLAGAFGLLTTQSLDNDYRGTLLGFARTVRTALFGAPDA